MAVGSAWAVTVSATSPMAYPSVGSHLPVEALERPAEGFQGALHHCTTAVLALGLLSMRAQDAFE
jgi:hypothetical protein